MREHIKHFSNTSEATDGTGDWLTLSRLATKGEDGTEFDGVVNFEEGEEDCFFKSDWFIRAAFDGDAWIAGFCCVVDYKNNKDLLSKWVL